MSTPGDSSEQEADRVAEQVSRQYGSVTLPSVQRSFIGIASTSASEPLVQGIHSHQGGGQALPLAIGQDLGTRLGADLRSVRVHTGADANAMNESIGALAFTHGKDVFFRQGFYDPHSASGKRLLAHELTHTLQQSGDGMRLQRQTSTLADVTSNADERTFYIAGASTFRKIKQLFLKVDVLFVGEPSATNVETKTPPGGAPTQFYVGKVSTISATTKAVKKLLETIAPAGSDVFVTSATFMTKLETLLAAFRKDHPTSFSNRQIRAIEQQAGVWVEVTKGGKTIKENSCIETMNKSIQNIYGSTSLKKEELSDTAIGTIGALKKKKLVKKTEKVSLLYTGTGRFQIRLDNIAAVTKFTPKSFSKTLTDIVADQQDGLYVTACSLLNGYHSILVIVKKLAGKYRFEWKDQDKNVELAAAQLDQKFYDYAAGRYSWRIRERYAKEFKTAVPDTYDGIKNEPRTQQIEKLEKTSVIDDLKTTTVALLSP